MKYSLITFLKNIKFLLSFNLNDEYENCMYETLLHVDDYCEYELPDVMRTTSLKVLEYSDTVDLLLNIPKSFCRFGDGELYLIDGKSVPFQSYDERLATILCNILKDNSLDYYVGINYNYFHSTRNLIDYNRKFYLLKIHDIRNKLIDLCNKDRQYIAAGFNQLYMAYKYYDFDNYYEKILKLFEGKDIVLFVGKGILDNLEYNVFKKSQNIEIVEGPNIDAFSKYDELLEKSRTYSKEKLLCFILGPTSKALVYELTKDGYMCWDIGHMAKDYDAYKRNVVKNAENEKRFFDPD